MVSEFDRGEVYSEHAVLTFLREEKLVDDDVVRVNFVRHELLHESFRLVQREELGDADTDEGGFFLVCVWGSHCQCRCQCQSLDECW